MTTGDQASDNIATMSHPPSSLPSDSDPEDQGDCVLCCDESDRKYNLIKHSSYGTYIQGVPKKMKTRFFDNNS